MLLARSWRRLWVWLGVRLGLLSGRWQRLRVRVPSARWFPGFSGGGAFAGLGAFGADSWSGAIYRPAGLRDQEAAPLIVLLHGCGQRALGFAHAAGFTRAADRDRFRLLCPEQRRLANPFRCWNWFAPRAQQGSGEQDVVLAMLDEAESRVQVSSVAVIGLSAGGALAALLAFHHASRFAAAVCAAAPPLLGRLNVQDPRAVMRAGLAVAPALAVSSLRAVAPLFVMQGEADDTVAPLCADQLAEQALNVRQREGPALSVTRDGEVEDHRAGDRLALRRVRLPGLGHRWSGGRGGHPYVERDGPSLTELALRFLRDAGVLRA